MTPDELKQAYEVYYSIPNLLMMTRSGLRDFIRLFCPFSNVEILDTESYGIYDVVIDPGIPDILDLVRGAVERYRSGCVQLNVISRQDYEAKDHGKRE